MKRAAARCRRPLVAAMLAISVAGCPQTEDAGDIENAEASAPIEAPPAPSPVAPDEVPEPDMTDMETQVEERLRERRSAVEARPTSAETWGRYGMVLHAHELWSEAEIAYREAQRLAPDDVRWPYYLGDVLSVVGTDPQTSIHALRRAMALRADYAPAHLRLGRALLAADRPDEAANELERALELEADLQPARVTLAQIELARGDLERSSKLLNDVLRAQPRHAQALSTLAQVYMRQGRRDEARAVARRTDDAAIYNLFSDPLMSKVVAEGVSSILLWERAKGQFDNGNFEQAALGLAQVAALLPDDAAVHHQLAVAYQRQGRLDGARASLERAVAADGEQVETRVLLGSLLIDQGQARPAIAHLERALGLAPNDPDAGWLLARAQVEAGAPRAALASFDTAAARAKADGRAIPTWAHNVWGSALAQSGQTLAAADRFRATLAEDPTNAQALFYLGLLAEGEGRTDRAVELYCRSMASQPNPPAAGRLSALGRICR
ncbi:MAG: tetratricopeptide repeat protein [Acidobacteriota bacterium]